MMHKGFESSWRGSNNNCGSSNPTNLRPLMQINNFKVPQESTRSSSRYEYPDHVNFYTSPTIYTGSSHSGMSHQYIFQGSHQVPSQWSSFYQNSNGYVVFDSKFHHKVPTQTQIPPLLDYKPQQSNNRNSHWSKNQKVNYSQSCVVKNKTDGSNKAQVNETIPKTPRIRVRDVSSVNNSICQGMNTSLCEPPRKEQTNNSVDHLLCHETVENNGVQKPHKNIPGVPEYGNLTKGYENNKLLIGQPSTEQECVLKNNFPNMMNLAPETVVNLKINTGNTNDGALPSSHSNPILSNIDLRQSVCPENYGNVLSGNKRVKIAPKRQQPLPVVGGNIVNTFLETQSNNLKSGFKRSEPHFSLPFGSFNEMACSILNTNQNHVQKSKLMNIITAECDSSTVPSSSMLPDLSCTESQSSIAPNVDNSNKKANAVHNRLNKNSLITKPQCSPVLNDPQRVKNALGIPVVINRNCEKPGLNVDKTNIKFDSNSKLGCSKPEKKHEFLNNKQGENQNFPINNICKETLSNSTEIRSSVKTETLDDSDSVQICLTSPDDPMEKESFSSQNFKDLTDGLCEPSFVETIEKESVTSPKKDSNHEFSEEWSDADSKRENKINRKKLDRLIEFLEVDVNSSSCNVEENTPRSKRAREDDVLNHNRRKLRKSSIVKNKNKTREMTSLVLYKPCRKELTCSTTVFESQEKNLDNETKEQIKGDEGPEGKINDRVCSTTKKANEKPEEEIHNRKKLSPRSSTKENFEGKKKEKKRKDKEKDLTMESEKQACEDPEETSIISTLRAFQKLQYHHCLSCNLNSSNDSFWINVVSGELRCLNCFKKMAMRMEKNALKSKNVLVNSVHESQVEDNNLNHGVEKKREHKNHSPNKIKTKAKETATKTPTKHKNEETRNSDKERERKKSEENREKHKNEVVTKEKSTGLQASSDKHGKKKKENTKYNSTGKSNSDKTVDKIETKSEKHKKKDKTKYESEREMDKKNSEKKTFNKSKESTDNQNVKRSKDLVEQTKQEGKPVSKSEGKLREGNSNAENKKNCPSAKTPEKFHEKKKKEEVKESKNDSRVLLERLYEKTKKVSLILFSED